jgi:spermidine synthase
MREFLSVFYGNELVFGIILANWLLLTGLGSYLGKYVEHIKEKIGFLIIAQIIIAVLPFFHIFLIRALRNVIFAPGALIGVTQTFLFSFLLLLPYCIIAGFLLTLACVVFSPERDAAQIGKVYFIDNIGDIIGGFLFSFILIYFLNPFQAVFFIMLVNLVAAFLLSNFIGKRTLSYSIVLLLLATIPVFFFVDLNTISTQLVFKGQEVVYQRSSLYGNLVVTKQLDQLNFFENGMPLFTTLNTISNEETVHYAMVQHTNPRNVLLISGGVAGTVNEVLKYGVERVDYVELDPQIIEAGRRFTTSLDNEKINVINKDGRLFVKQTSSRYDVVIVDLPDPNNAQINRFYTREFFNEIRRILNSDGVVSISVSSSANYLSIETRRLNSALYKTLNEEFSNIIIIPGERNYFVASDRALSYDIARLIDERGVATKYVNAFYLKGKLTPDRINPVLESVREDVSPNTDFNPVSYYYHLLYWMSHFGLNLTIALIVFGVLTILFLTRLKPVSFSIFTTGFAGASLEVVLLIGFQVLYGYVYHMVGVIITSFMLGLAIGAYYMNKKLKLKSAKDFVLIEFLIAGFSIALPLILILLTSLKGGIGIFLGTKFLFPFLTIIIAILVGMEFPLASKLFFKDVASTAAVLYNADLIGACVGALLVSALLIPILGIIKVCFLVGVLNVVSGMIVWMKR